MAGFDALDQHDLGLAYDLSTLARRQRSVLDRRHAMKLIGGLGVLALAACGRNAKSVTTATSATTTSTSSSSAGATTTTGGSSTTGAANTTCETIPDETAGPFPGDGSNGPNALTESGIVRSDITSSFGSSTTTAPGVPLTINLVILDQSNGCKALAGAAVYVWHCTRDGKYSMYSQGVTNENFLRGVQATDASGRATFKSIFPGAYSGRWPHIHFEVYPSLAKATAASNKIATSQIALPEAACNAAYATSGYEASVGNMKQTSLAGDNVFRDDGGVRQLPTITGSPTAGFTIELSVPV
jgi:protocatechuate 3,4-dioxygenase beta subunit